MEFNVDSFGIFDKTWALLTAGNGERFNTMTISWGGLGTLWSKPVATVYVRPSRYTHEFMEDNEYFTVSFYPEECRKALAILGRESGRDGDKVSKAGLHPVAAGQSMTFREAEITLVCKKLYRQDLDKSAIVDEESKRHYGPEEAAHTMYIGEVVEILK